jgi:hypothetical protein
MRSADKIGFDRRGVRWLGWTLGLILTFETLVALVVPKVENAAIVIRRFDKKNLLKIPSRCNRLVLGCSRSLHGVIPPILDEGTSFYTWNLSGPNMQIPFIYFVTRRFLETHRAPKAIILNAVGLEFNVKGVDEIYSVYFRYYKPNLWECWNAYRWGLRSLLESVKWYIVPRIPSLRHRKRLNALLSTDWRNFWRMMEQVPGITRRLNDFCAQGYISKGMKVLDIDALELMYSEVEKLWMGGQDPVFLKYLDAFFQLIQQNHIKVYVYNPPFPECFRESDAFMAQWHRCVSQIDRYIQKYHPWVERLPNTEFFENRFLADMYHTNEIGSVRVSKELRILMDAREQVQKMSE